MSTKLNKNEVVFLDDLLEQLENGRRSIIPPNPSEGTVGLTVHSARTKLQKQLLEELGTHV